MTNPTTKRKRTDSIDATVPETKKIDYKAAAKAGDVIALKNLSSGENDEEEEEEERSEDEDEQTEENDEDNENIAECQNCGEEFGVEEGGECSYHDCK